MISRFQEAAADPETAVVIYTGTGPYFCSGGSLSEYLGRSVYIAGSLRDTYLFAILFMKLNFP